MGSNINDAQRRVDSVESRVPHWWYYSITYVVPVSAKAGNSEGGRISMADLLVLTGKESAASRKAGKFFHLKKKPNPNQ